MKRILLFPDVNNDGGSSASTGAASDNQQSDVNNQGADSSDAQGDKDTTKETKEPTMAEAIQEVLDGKLKSENAEESRSKNEQDAKDENEKEVEGEGEADDKDENEKENEEGKDSTEGDEAGKDKARDEKLVEGKPVPYERFTEINTQLKSAQQELARVKPAVDNYTQIDTFCRANGITPQQFGKVLEIQALLNTNPEAALKELLPIVDSLKGFTGEALPQDLQLAVDSGEISLKYAKEVSASRAKLQFGERKIQHDQQSLARQQQAIVQQQLSDAVSVWENTKRNSDPDYKPKAKPTDPDGKWEKVKKEFLGMLHETNASGELVRPVKTPAQFTALMEEAYESVNSYTKRISAPKPTRRPLRSSSSPVNNRNQKSIEEAPTLQEAVARGLALRR